MAVCIRLSRSGRIHRPFFRIVAIDKRNAREGLSNEVLGTYDPTQADGKAVTVKADRVEAWLAKGALISDALDSIFKHHGIAINRPVAAKAKRTTKKTDKKPAKPAAKKGEKAAFVPASRRALKKHAAKLKAERKAKAAAEAPKAEAAAEAPKA